MGDTVPAEKDWFHKWVHSGHHVETHHTSVTHHETVTSTVTVTTVVHTKFLNLVNKCNTNTYNARRRCTIQVHNIEHRIHDVRYVLHRLVHTINWYRHHVSICHHTCLKSCGTIINWYTGYLYHRKRKGDFAITQ